MDSFLATSAFLTPAEGQISRLRLADQGIECRLEGFDLVTWLWHLSLAFQGVKLVVRSSDAERAAAILSVQPVQASAPETTRACSRCEERVPNDWHVCWRCGTDETGQHDETFFQETACPLRIVSVVQNVEYLGLWLVLATLLFLEVPAIAIAFMLMTFVLMSRDRPQAVTATFPPEDFAAYPDCSSTSEDTLETNRRALASAMFGLVWFPPLTIYSIWILLNCDEGADDARIRLWRRAAWSFDFVGLLTFMSLIGLCLRSSDEWELSWWMGIILDTFLVTSRSLMT